MEKAWHPSIHGVATTVSRTQDLIDEIARIESAKMEHPLPCYGSIFFRRDLGPETASVVIDDTFAIGPSLARMFWSDEREAMDIDRGPCEFIF
jgi:hypothetical protein